MKEMGEVYHGTTRWLKNCQVAGLVCRTVWTKQKN